MAAKNTGGGEGQADGGGPNRLIHENSPYLLDHAFNPVAWYPWGDEAFREALRRDCPIFLSIGYSTCHWCHVMAHESFEDPLVASLLNDAFVCIKVDREERPDIDELYMAAALVLSRSGGWPLTIVMTPEKKPFFAATYIPKEDRFAMQGLTTIIPRIVQLWRDARDELIMAAEQVTGSVGREVFPAPPGSPVRIDSSMLDSGYAALRIRYDLLNGGFGSAPKFPSPHIISFLLRYAKRTGKPGALSMAQKTLGAMAMGGIYDHLGSGFHRYSTDARWIVPHFEKMLYDQALLVTAYIEAYQVTGDHWYLNIAEDCLSYLTREMASPEGGFFSAEDADSEGSEGTYYLWSASDLDEVLGKDAPLFARAYNVSRKGNFRERGPDSPSGKNVLYRTSSFEKLAESAGMPEREYREQLAEMRTRLLQVRETRTPPAKDDKILTDWNGLAVSSFSLAAMAFSEESYLETARMAADFLLRTMKKENGELLHRYRNGRAGVQGLGSDYAYLTAGLLDLFEASQEPRYLGAALDIQAWFTRHFADGDEGGFFTSGDGTTDLIARKKDIYDGALPSVNSVTFRNLQRLGLFTSDPGYHEQAWHLARCFAGTVEQSSESYTGFLSALDFALGPSYEIVLSGRREDNKIREMRSAIGRCFLPSKVIIFRPSDADSTPIDRLTGFTGSFPPGDDRAAAWVCKNHACGLPVHDVSPLLASLGKSPGDFGD
ncbi:MAG TPA: thioredoxin domain-containing protein [Methanoregulaceae archaeon]|nr:thioredoxin domain-containing protein [Methanoregulaceae archaeon]